MFNKKVQIPDHGAALPGRNESISVTNRHFVNGHPIQPPFPAGMVQAMFGLGCFWGAEDRKSVV